MSQQVEQAVGEIYAEALFSLALERGEQVVVRGELDELGRALATDAEFGAFLENPGIRRSEKKRALEETLAGRVSDLTMDFLGVVGDKDRLAFLGEMCTAYGRLEDAHAGRIEATIVTAVEVGEQDLLRLAEQVGRVFQKTVRLKPKVDPDIMGGMILVIDQKVYDGSVKRNLTQFHQRMRRSLEQQFAAMGLDVDDSSG